MRYVSSAEMRDIDEATRQHTCQFPDVPDSDQLIKLAAQGVVNLILEHCGASRPSVHVVFGNGHNGADALYAGWALAEHGFAVQYHAALEMAGAKDPVKRLANAVRCPRVDWFSPTDSWVIHPPSTVERGAVIIDGILGISVDGAPRGAAAAAIQWINRLKGRAHIVAIDVPSGLNADTGAALGEVVEADLTVCMGLPKRGMVQPSALAQTGSIYVNDLDIDAGLLRGHDADAATERDELVTERDVAEWIPCRAWDANKGDFGHVCIVGGAPGYTGATALVALAALRTGAGLVSAFVPEGVATGVSVHAPEMMVHALPMDTVSAFGLMGCGFDFSGKTVVAGPGMSRQKSIREAVIWLLERSGAAAFVLDADALNVLADDPAPLVVNSGRVVVTPHPGEAARLLGCSATEVQADRPAALRDLVRKLQCVVVLKGAGTLVSAPEQGIHLVASVNPGMARGGMGDVLAGMTGALLARGLPAFEAACAAAWLHARAGDFAAWRIGREAMLATDLLEPSSTLGLRL